MRTDVRAAGFRFSCEECLKVGQGFHRYGSTVKTSEGIRGLCLPLYELVCERCGWRYAVPGEVTLPCMFEGHEEEESRMITWTRMTTWTAFKEFVDRELEARAKVGGSVTEASRVTFILDGICLTMRVGNPRNNVTFAVEVEEAIRPQKKSPWWKATAWLSRSR